MDSDQYIDSLFQKAGWFSGRDIKIAQSENDLKSIAFSNAIKIIREFGGLSVGEVGAGRDLSASDICFRTETFSFSTEFNHQWPSLKRELFAYATAHHDHMMLLVDENNDTYIFTDPNEELYFGGTFQETTKKVLLGINYGVAIEKT